MFAASLDLPDVFAGYDQFAQLTVVVPISNVLSVCYEWEQPGHSNGRRERICC